MENHHKITKEKLNKLKLINKINISFKNSFIGIKPKNRLSNINTNKIINYKSFTENTKYLIIQKNLKKYNTSMKKYNKNIINSIIFDHRIHIVAVFKNYLLWDETSEFLKRYYKKKDNQTRLPKIAEYYQQYTLFTPNYFGYEGLIVIIMVKYMKRKKKYLKYLEDKEDEEDNNKNKKTNNKDFEPLLQNEIFGKNKSKSLFSSFLDVSKNTLELTNYDNDLTYKVETKRKSTNKITVEKNYKNQFDNNKNFCKNSMSFTEIFDDLSSHFSILINNNYRDYIEKSKKIPIKSFTNKTNLPKKEINQKNTFKKLSTKHTKQKSISKKNTPNKQQNESKNESNNQKSKGIYRLNNNIYKKKNNTKKINLTKEHKSKEKNSEKNNEKEKEKLFINKDNRKNYKHFTNNNLKQKEHNLSKNTVNKKNIDINNNNNNNNSNINPNNNNNQEEGNIFQKLSSGLTNISNTINSIGEIGNQLQNISSNIRNNPITSNLFRSESLNENNNRSIRNERRINLDNANNAPFISVPLRNNTFRPRPRVIIGGRRIIRNNINHNHNHINSNEVERIMELLPCSVLTEKKDGENNECIICLSEFEVGDSITTLPCVHIFHNECIKNWLKNNNHCPICKFEITLNSIIRDN